MDLKSLSTFVVVSETGSFTRAGQRLQVSQSAVSQQIRALEESLGSSLYSRRSRKVTLTQAGNVLLPYARQILAKADEARAMISDYEGMGRGRVVVGAGGAICHHVLPSVLREFTERFAKIEIQVLSGISADTLQRTVDGTVDIGLLLMPVNHPGVVTTELGRDELVAIAPKGHAWDKLERVTPKDFINEQLVAYERNSETFRILERFLLEEGVFPTVAMEISDLEAVKEMVKVGLGVSVVAGWAARTDAGEDGLIARPLGRNGQYRTWGLIRRANDTLTASQKGLVAVCESRFPTLLA